MTAPSREAEWASCMRAAMGGDVKAYRRFLVSVTPHLRAVVRSRCHRTGVSEGEAEDIVQEVLLAIHLKRGSWDRSRPIGPWLAAIARNKLVDILRRRGRQASVPIEEVMDTLQAEEPASTLATRDLDVMLEQLKSRQREIVRSISLDGNSVRETASRLHMTEGAVRVALHRALKSLAERYRRQSHADR
jgi:RNA polymerase sigma factor (sigma-70 family)